MRPPYEKLRHTGPHRRQATQATTQSRQAADFPSLMLYLFMTLNYVAFVGEAMIPVGVRMARLNKGISAIDGFHSSGVPHR
jgi:hypothetical protein